MTWRRIVALCICLLMLPTLPALASGEASYGPGHESHQYACWDNGDGTHTVACDCGAEKRVEPHADAGDDGACDGCGLDMNASETGHDTNGLEASYGPGHESHQYACWDNGDGTHTVACDCGAEKRVEPHADDGDDGTCDGCGLDMNPVGVMLPPDGWMFTGYLSGGVAYAVPEDVVMWELTDEQLRAGVVAVVSNADITVQLRGYEPWEMTYDEFVGVVKGDTMADCEIFNVGETEITSYRNPDPGKQSELCGVVLTGLDGRMYKLSVFSGDNGRIDGEAKVWELIDILVPTVHTMDFSGLDIGQ